MGRTVTERFRLTSTVAEVMDLLADPDFVEARLQTNTGLRGEVVSHEVDDTRIVIRTSAQIPMDWLPARVAGAVSVQPSVLRIEDWDRQTGRGTTAFEFTGVPATAEGTMSVTSDGSGVVVAQKIRLTVDLPIVGGLVEQGVARQISRALQGEAQAYRRGRPIGPET